MFKSLLNLARRPNRVVTDALYDQIVAAARQTPFYSQWAVPDTPLGRFEMLAVHMMLFLERARRGGSGLDGIAQDITDDFFKDVEHSLRELGIGDLGVPKRMKKLAKMFYGRAEAYRAALDAGDSAALAAALARNVRPEAQAWPQAAEVAGYMAGALDALGSQSDADIRSGKLAFPCPGGRP